MNFAKNCMLFETPIPKALASAVGAKKAAVIKEVACVVSGYMVIAAMLLFAVLHV